MSAVNDSAVIKYINEYLTAKKMSLILPSAKFHRIELGGFALRVERHTEFLTISFVEKGLKVKSGISDDAFWTNLACCTYRLNGRKTHQRRFLTRFGLRLVASHPQSCNNLICSKILKSRAVASNNFSDTAAQVHFAFDIDKDGSPHRGI